MTLFKRVDLSEFDLNRFYTLLEHVFLRHLVLVKVCIRIHQWVQLLDKNLALLLKDFFLFKPGWIHGLHLPWQIVWD